MKKRLTFLAPEYSRTLFHAYDFAVPTISSCKSFRKFVNKSKTEVSRVINVDTSLQYDKDKKSYVFYNVMFTETWKNKIETDIVLGDYSYIEIWFSGHVYERSKKPFQRELSSKVKLCDTIKIKDPSKYDPNLFRLEGALGERILDKQDEIERMISDHSNEIKISFTGLLDTLALIQNDLTEGRV